MTYKNPRVALGLGLGLVFLLQIVWHMPGTIALRNSLLGLFAVTTLVFAFQNRNVLQHGRKFPVAPAICLGLLTIWIVIVNAGWADRPGLSWAEFRSQWILPLISGVFAWLFAETALARSEKLGLTLLKIVFWAYFLQVGLHDLMDIWFYVERGSIPFRNAPVLDIPEMLKNYSALPSLLDGFSGQHPGFFSYVNSILAAMLVAEVVQRFLTKEHNLPYGKGILLLGLVGVLFCSYTLRMRNGNVGLLLLLVFVAVMLVYRLAGKVKAAKLMGGLLMFIVGVSAVGYAFIKSDERWIGLVDTVPYAWNTKAHDAWLNGPPYPVMPNGQVVEISAYERTAWTKEGLILLAEKPLGSGYDRNAWGGRLDDKYGLGGKSRGGHSHNGILDFAIATGIPGALLWLCFMGSLALAGFRAFRDGRIVGGLMLIFLVTGYFGRTLVDSVIRDHFLQVFMFLAGWFLALCQPPRKTG